MVSSDLADLLRQSSLTYGHIQLFRDEAGWQASVCHYGPERRDVHDGRAFADPAEALRKALLEDQRRSRDVARRYDIAMSERPAQIDLEEAIAAAVPPTVDPFADLLG